MSKYNQVMLSGCVASGFTFSHELYGEKFYTANIAVQRCSDAVDIIPAMFSERLINTTEDYTDAPIQIYGQFRSYNQHEENRTKLLLYIFVLDYQWMEDTENINKATLEGYICKKPIYRVTPFGREIADVLLAVNRPYGKSDYIPCIVWGRNARYVETLEIGSCIRLYGRIQSREYIKTIGDTEERKTAYELSVSKMETVA